MAGTAVTASGGVVADITSDCGIGCISITYFGAPGPSPAGNAVKLVSPDHPTWGKMSDFGLSGDWTAGALALMLRRLRVSTAALACPPPLRWD
jgi:hypothetical protein